MYLLRGIDALFNLAPCFFMWLHVSEEFILMMPKKIQKLRYKVNQKYGILLVGSLSTSTPTCLLEEKK